MDSDGSIILISNSLLSEAVECRTRAKAAQFRPQLAEVPLRKALKLDALVESFKEKDLMQVRPTDNRNS